MASINMDDRHKYRTAKYVTLAVLVLVVASLFLPVWDGLSLTGFVGDRRTCSSCRITLK